ncbi:MAG TPA: hypothetical protein VFB79_03620 [Candidatus Angelobacter sp.]|nr:hypothetical protein [Candidatus Angelobacter sp.]
MTITFADGTHLEVAATAFDEFVKHDLKWAEFVHGRASTEPSCCKQVLVTKPVSRSAHPCPSGSC